MASAIVGARKTAIAQILVGLLLFIALDASIFGSGFYLSWASPDSGVGRLHYVLETNIETATNGRAIVLAFGDSRLAEGFSARLATAEAERLGGHTLFLNSGVPGTTPRVWYYMLRAYRDRGLRPIAVLYMTTSYRANARNHQPDFPLDLAHLHPFLTPRDALFLASSFRDTDLREAAFSAALFKGASYHADVLDLFSHPFERLRSVGAWRRDAGAFLGGYEGHEESLAGLTLDPATGALRPPAGAETAAPEIRAYAERLLREEGAAKESEAVLAYDRLWFGAAAELCKQMGATLIVFRIPAGPLNGLFEPRPEAGGALAELAASGQLRLIPADAFDGLEQPQFFFDETHMNRAGRAEFSPRLAREALPLIPK